MGTSAEQAREVVAGGGDLSGGEERAYPRRWLALLVLLAAAFMDLLDSTIVNVALPTMRTSLGASYGASQWIVAGYTLTFGLGLILGGRLGDRWGRRTIFLVGITVFTLASLTCGVSPNPTVLVIARLVQGLGSALMVPQVMATVYAVFPRNERGSAGGAYGGMAGLAAVAGPILGGVLVQYNVFGLSWRAVFLINVPIGIIAIIAALMVVPQTKSVKPLRMDLIGTILVTIALLVLLYPLVQGRDAGWPKWMFIIMIGAPVLLLVYLVHARSRQRRGEAPLVPLRLFSHRAFGAGLFVLLVLDVAMIGFALALSLLMQEGYGYSPIRTGLTFLPWALGGGIGSGIGPRLTPKIARFVPTIGSLLMAAGMAWIAIATNAGALSWGMSIPGLAVFGIGMGMTIGPTFTIAGADIDTDDAGAASGTLTAGLAIGSAAGVAVLGVLYFNIIVGSGGAAIDAQQATITNGLTQAGISQQVSSQVFPGVRQCFVDTVSSKDPSVQPASCKQAEQGGNTATGATIAKVVTPAVKTATATAFGDGFRFFVWFAVAGMILAALFCQFMPRKLDHVNEFIQ